MVFESKGTKINYGSSKKIMNDDANWKRISDFDVSDALRWTLLTRDTSMENW